MTYPNTRSAIFLSRPNRFIALVEMDGVIETVHVKNTGRCMELLIPGAAVYLNQCHLCPGWISRSPGAAKNAENGD